MKRVLFIAVALMMAAPALATVNFTATDIGSGQLRIAYSSDAGEEPRGIALVIDAAGATVDSGFDHVSGDAAFNTFMDFAYGDPATYNVGDGHGIANAAAAGTPTEWLSAGGASVFSLSLGVLDQGGGQAAGPGSTSNLATIQLHSTIVTTITVTITADTLRGPSSGVVGSTLDSNIDGGQLTIDVVVGPGGICAGAIADWSDEWDVVGNPDCWCNEVSPRQCYGDADNAKQGRFNYAVSTDDLNILSDAWNKGLAATLGTGTEGDGVSGGVPWICADFDRTSQGRFNYRVSTDDLNILSDNWNVPNGPADTCQNIRGEQIP